MPNISTIDPENTTGNTDIVMTRKEKLPKTLPLRPGGVDSCKNVCEGTSIATKPNPIATSVRNESINLKMYAKSGTIKVKNRSDMAIVNKAASMSVFFLTSLFKILGIKRAPKTAPIPAGTSMYIPALFRGIFKIFFAKVGN